MAPRPASLKVRALQWLAQREHSRTELRVRLLRAAAGRPVAAMSTDADADADHGHCVEAAGLASGDALTEVDGAGPGIGAEVDAHTSRGRGLDHAPEVDALLDWLSSRGYLSDQRFIDSRIHSRQSRFGNLRIERELAQHGLAAGDETRQQLRDSELSRAREVWQRKYGANATADTAERLRQMRFLAGRGFSHEVVRRIVRGLPDDDC
ncbi:regulatory protein RecX [Aquabacterium sp. OR-4]|uniref:regulatory protein RecX n=1 Tax=Aquabacterium sp. OR-4 TaxID=2978127 RepID=UPI0021B2687A|nr:regulatory protein RecX [Aquabacterium sp. OR-4]MDT7833930.1 regulatory protein RecX [Aquabacterium sp. OR-4]